MTEAHDPSRESHPAREEEWVTIAHLLRPQGRKGEVLAELLTDFPERFGEQPHVFLQTEAGARRPAEIEAHWLPVGRNAGRVVLKFAGVDSIEAAEAIAYLDVVIPAEARVPLEDGAVYINELIGCSVLDAGAPVGVIEDVQFPVSPDGSQRIEDAAATLVVRSPGGKEILIPFARDFVLDIDSAAREVRMQLPAGLVDLYLE